MRTRRRTRKQRWQKRKKELLWQQPEEVVLAQGQEQEETVAGRASSPASSVLRAGLRAASLRTPQCKYARHRGQMKLCVGRILAKASPLRAPALAQAQALTLPPLPLPRPYRQQHVMLRQPKVTLPTAFLSGLRKGSGNLRSIYKHTHKHNTKMLALCKLCEPGFVLLVLAAALT